MTWQDISTAPRMGEQIILWIKAKDKYWPINGYWAKGYWWGYNENSKSGGKFLPLTKHDFQPKFWSKAEHLIARPSDDELRMKFVKNQVMSRALADLAEQEYGWEECKLDESDPEYDRWCEERVQDECLNAGDQLNRSRALYQYDLYNNYAEGK